MQSVYVNLEEGPHLVWVAEVANEELQVLEALLYPSVCEGKATVVVWCKYQLSGGCTAYSHFG